MFVRHARLSFALIFVAVFGLSAVPISAKTTINDEIKIGKKTAAQIEKKYPVTENKQWLAEIDQLGKMLIVNVTRKEIPYTFKILKEQNDGQNELDAFSLPGGPVYFSERMWRLLTRDERIGVLSHEITHVDKRHAIDTISEAQRRSMWATAVLLVTGAKGALWDAADFSNQLYTLKFSRKRETEADMGGIDLCVAAHQTPSGLVTAMKKLKRLESEQGGRQPKILSTHPATKDRVDYMTRRVLELGVKPENLEPKYVNGPDRLGDVVARLKKKTIQISTKRPLSANDAVLIKKPLWDDDSNSLTPQTVATGVVKTAGSQAQVTVTMEPMFEFVDLESGDGVYLAPVPKPPK